MSNTACVHWSAVASALKIFIFQIYEWCRGYLPSHVLGCLLLSLPILAVLVNFQCDLTQQHAGHYAAYRRDHYLQLIFISIAHFTNLSALNYGVKSGVATVFSIVTCVIFSSAVCPDEAVLASTEALEAEDALVLTPSQNLRFFELVTCISTLTILVWIINREFELSYRLSYLCSRLSARDKRKVQTLKNQADWLLHNIIPR